MLFYGLCVVVSDVKIELNVNIYFIYAYGHYF